MSGESSVINAVMDIGTNSIKLLAARSKGIAFEVLEDRAVVSRLGEGSSESGMLSDEAMKRSLVVIEELARRAGDLGAPGITAVGTQAMRASRNAGDFIRMVRDACGVEIKVIGGDAEAELSFLASAGYAGLGDVCLFDVGGGSSEIAAGCCGGINYRRSLPVGALSLFQKFFEHTAGRAVSPDILEEAAHEVAAIIGGDNWPDAGVAKCVGVGGTATTLAAVHLERSAHGGGSIGGAVLPISEITRQIELYSGMTAEERKSIPGLPPERADIILPGACIVRELMKYGGFNELTVSDRGLRYGVMQKLLA